MNAYSAYANCAPNGLTSTKQQRAQREREEAERDQAEREAHVRRANAATAVAKVLVEQNERMIAGMRASSMLTQPCSHHEKVDHIARNIASVGPRRSNIGPREQRLMARAEVMAAATQHLEGAAGASHTLARRTKYSASAPADNSADLVRAAREEVERGMGISAYESATRRAPAKLTGLGRACTFGK